MKTVCLYTCLLVAAPAAVLCPLAQALEPANPKKAAAALPERVTFNAHIRPIMSNTCFVCHGPDQEQNESGYRLDSFAAATRKLPSADDLVGIRPGSPEASEVFLRVTGRGSGGSMPPPDFRHQLSDYERALIGRWIEQGANYEVHWAYAPLVRPAVPNLTQLAQEVANPIDAFILARLEREGLTPSPLADKATQLRRLSLDLIGLPPTPAELLTYLADTSEQAYTRQVERLLDSPHFGERMASGWLDLVRFADTVGFHGDQNQRIFAYRDYVIDAFNTNKPFDQFTREQLAGDLEQSPTPQQLTATGFLRLNMVTREGGAQPGEYLAKYRADRVRALGTAWLGATLACCECHNHKYDPFSIKDFYAFGAFFDDLRQWGVYADYGYTPNPDLKGFNNDSPFPPETRVHSQSLVQQIESLARQRDRLVLQEIGEQTLESSAAQQWLQKVTELQRQFPDGWVAGRIIEAQATPGTKVQVQADSVLCTAAASSAATDKAAPRNAGVSPGARRKNKDKDNNEDNSPDNEQITLLVAPAVGLTAAALRLEVLPDPVHNGLVGRGPAGSFSVKLAATLAEQALPLAWAEADRQNPSKYNGGAEPLTLGDTWRSGPLVWQFPEDETRQPHTAVYHFQQPLELTAKQPLKLVLSSSDIGRVRIAFTPLGHAIAGWPAISSDLRQALRAPVAGRTPAQLATLVSAYHRSTTPVAQQSTGVLKFRDAILAQHSGLTMTMIAQALPADQLPTSRVLPRGNWQDTTGQVVVPGFPEFLPRPARDDVRRLDRRDLAEWLVARDNPLTPRHFVNHTWKRFFGSGLSNKLDDLGNQGEWPSHPELLDWLAAEFVDSGWNIKHLVRTIVHSRSYRQTAAQRSDLEELDPYNRLLAQQSPRRLEAEIIRDNALAIAGLLNLDFVGGPSVFPYQPDGHYNNLQFPDRKYVDSPDDRQYRRGLYMHWQRTFLHPMLVNFDAPSRDECAAERTLSNSPQQALTLLNDPSFVEAARVMAEQLLAPRTTADAAAATAEQLLDQAFLRAVGRPCQPAEQAGLLGLLDRQRAHYAQQPQEAADLLAVGLRPPQRVAPPEEVAAWTQVCRVILNLHETITR